MRLRERLIAQLQRYDDEAFAALANRGLLRRAQKDLEKQQATIAEEHADALVVAFGEHRIRFDARGPAHAECSCPASTVCQHILAAAIGLQRMAAAPAADARDAGDSLEELERQLLELTAVELTRHAGRPGYRWAWQFVQDLPPEGGLRIGGERHIVLSSPIPGCPSATWAAASTT